MKNTKKILGVIPFTWGGIFILSVVLVAFGGSGPAWAWYLFGAGAVYIWFAYQDRVVPKEYIVRTRNDGTTYLSPITDKAYAQETQRKEFFKVQRAQKKQNLIKKTEERIKKQFSALT